MKSIILILMFILMISVFCYSSYESESLRSELSILSEQNKMLSQTLHELRRILSIKEQSSVVPENGRMVNIKRIIIDGRVYIWKKNITKLSKKSCSSGRCEKK